MGEADDSIMCEQAVLSFVLLAVAYISPIVSLIDAFVASGFLLLMDVADDSSIRYVAHNCDPMRAESTMSAREAACMKQSSGETTYRFGAILINAREGNVDVWTW